MAHPISQQSWSSFRHQYGSDDVRSGASRAGNSQQEERSRVYFFLGGILSVLNCRRQRRPLSPHGKRRLFKGENIRKVSIYNDSLGAMGFTFDAPISHWKALPAHRNIYIVESQQRWTLESSGIALRWVRTHFWVQLLHYRICKTVRIDQEQSERAWLDYV